MQLPHRRSQQLKRDDDSDDVVLLTADGIQKLKDTLVFLEKQERPKIVEDLSQALLLGDFSENAEYIDAKARLARIDGRIFGIKDRLRRAQVIKPEQRGSFIELGSTVVVEVNGKEKTYQIVGPQETNPARGRISNLSPLGAALLGRLRDEVVTVKTEGGETAYRIIDVW